LIFVHFVFKLFFFKTESNFYSYFIIAFPKMSDMCFNWSFSFYRFAFSTALSRTNRTASASDPYALATMSIWFEIIEFWTNIFKKI
jgi:hypothetical protein